MRERDRDRQRQRVSRRKRKPEEMASLCMSEIFKFTGNPIWLYSNFRGQKIEDKLANINQGTEVKSEFKKVFGKSCHTQLLIKMLLYVLNLMAGKVFHALVVPINDRVTKSFQLKKWIVEVIVIPNNS